MTTENIITRLEDLCSVLAYCSHRKSKDQLPAFSLSERILINQERGSLLSQLNYETPPALVRNYTCPPELNAKIRFNIQKIADTNWKPELKSFEA
ncbi:hypothetical protein GON26_20460 [Flavobacterium sp. GA093]|uniref:Uncharacterized protein n=1 Tax=Flavobacterium hydrocarbonoxydans TaxID=2683249 RepID=A0A6I4NUH8_9FLAO|nr:hypothetical protein [Flavobacterium hydrocarbonoxydans]MWB96742.1 hypothetical protein [Flavobacterium hydrocarbonoxydans]